MSNVIDINEPGELQDLIDTEPVVVVKFTAPAWCRPCQQFKPHFEKAAESASLDSSSLGSTRFVSVDIDDNEWAMVDYGVRGVPTVMLYLNGEYVKNLQERSAVKFLAEIKSSI